MDPIQDIVVQWWANADSSTQMAVIAFGIFMLAIATFSIIGTYTNPSRRPHNEMDFRKFQQASLAAKAPPAADAEPESDPEPEEPARRSYRLGRL